MVLLMISPGLGMLVYIVWVQRTINKSLLDLAEKNARRKALEKIQELKEKFSDNDGAINEYELIIKGLEEDIKKKRNELRLLVKRSKKITDIEELKEIEELESQVLGRIFSMQKEGIRLRSKNPFRFICTFLLGVLS